MIISLNVPRGTRKALAIALGLAFLAGSLIGVRVAEELSRQRLLADFGWKFIREDATNAQQAGFDDARWRSLNLPHDWSIEGPYSETAPTGGSGGYLPTGVGWYRRSFTAPEAWRGKKVFIEF